VRGKYKKPPSSSSPKVMMDMSMPMRGGYEWKYTAISLSREYCTTKFARVIGYKAGMPAPKRRGT
jgi:hypothetical protein